MIEPVTSEPKRAKRPRATAPPVEGPLRLRYDLADLPSTQHRAGLAGLVLMLEWLDRAPGEKPGICRLAECDERGATVEFDAAGLSRTFDELFDATTEEQASDQQRKDKSGALIPPLRTEERIQRDAKTGKEKRKTVFLYPATVPRARLLVDFERGDNQGPWVKLWRNMIWSILRGVPATREPFDARAERRPSSDAAETWIQLVDENDPELELPSTYYLGAMAKTAENVGFFDRARRQLLLHFWPYAARIYVPQRLDIKEGRYDFHGFAIAIPDVCNLIGFCRAYRQMMARRGQELERFRPREAVIDLAVEAALDAAGRLRDTVVDRESQKLTQSFVFGFDVLHLGKEGNNVRVYCNTRITPDDELLNEYERLRGQLWDPLFRRQVLLNTLEGRRWFEGFDRIFATVPHKTQAIGRRQFCRDAIHMFNERRDLMEKASEEPGEEKHLDVLVRDMVRNYVFRRAEQKSGTNWEKSKDNTGLKRVWEEKKQDIAEEGFLAARARTGADFVNWFVGTLCSRGQFLDRARFSAIAMALHDPTQTAQVRTLTLLALSAENWVFSSPSEKKSEA